MPAKAASETILWNFKYSSKGTPQDRLLLSNGKLFGTGYGYGDGEVFELTKSGSTWNETTLLGFSSSAGPYGGVIGSSSGPLYGTTVYGGTSGNGEVYELTYSGGTWTATTIWSFAGGPSDGANPYCDLIKDGSGNLYGTTSAGGFYSNGTVFELTPSGGSWTEKILYSFGATPGDGGGPVGGLHKDSAGNFYGTTQNGGASSEGAVYELSPFGSSWNESVLYSFTGGSDGAYPEAALIADSSGSLYSTTLYGGKDNVGTVFELSLSSGVWKEKTLHSFTGGSDGSHPQSPLHWGPTQTTLYGTAGDGGSHSYGVAFKLTKSAGKWSETVLHSFGAGTDGAFADGGLITDSSGNLYGTTYVGGTNGWGIVYEITP